MNTATRKTAPKSRRIVTLDPSQYALYQSGTIELRAPDGEVLETLGTYMHRAESQVAQERARLEIELLVALLGNTGDFLELNKNAVSGLQDILHRAGELLR